MQAGHSEERSIASGVKDDDLDVDTDMRLENHSEEDEEIQMLHDKATASEGKLRIVRRIGSPQSSSLKRPKTTPKQAVTSSTTAGTRAGNMNKSFMASSASNRPGFN